MEWIRTKGFLRAVAVTVIFALVTWAYPEGQQTQLRQIFVPQTAQFTTQHPGRIESFDISPNGTTLAIEFSSRCDDGTYGIWVTLWNVDTERLDAAKEVECSYPTYKKDPYLKGLPFLWYRQKISFSPDGRLLVVLTGPRVVGLNLPELKVLYAIEDRVLPENALEQKLLTDFSVSLTARRLAVLRQYMADIFPHSSLEVEIADLHDGRILAKWDKPGHSASIALSPDGNSVALTIDSVRGGARNIPQGQNNVFVLNSGTGEVVHALNTGYRADDAQFLPGGAKLMTAPGDHGEPQFYPRDAMTIWDVPAERMVQELLYPKYGVRGRMVISADGEWLAVTDPWHNPSDIKWDRPVREWVRLLVWNVPTGRLVYESRELPQAYSLHGGVPGLLVLVRMSASGNRLAVGGERISVYSVESVPVQSGKR